MVAVELLGVGITPRHHRRLLGDAQIGLPQPRAMVAGQAIEPLDRRMQQLGVGWEGDVLGLHRGVDRDPRQIPGPQRAAENRFAFNRLAVVHGQRVSMGRVAERF
jgi:hypothetical protein